MNRNSENHFATTPQVAMQRSTFKTPKNIKTTFNTGLLIPFYVNANVYPGETYKFNLSAVIRQSTPIHPTMDDAYADFYFFYDRKRNLWNHWNEFMGENTTGAWASSIEYTEPQIKFNSHTTASNKHSIIKGDIAHYMGLPIFSDNTSTDKEILVSRLPFTSYIRIWNNFFRNQNLEAPAYEPKGDSTIIVLSDASRSNSSLNNWHATGINTQTSIQPKPAPVNKFADYFTTCNLSPQKSTAPVTLPIGSLAPVAGNGMALGLTEGTTLSGLYAGQSGLNQTTQAYGADVGTSLDTFTGVTTNKAVGVTEDIEKSGLYADLSNAVAATINAQRLAFATQRIYERDTFGTRIWEVIKNHFQTTVDEKVIGIPEYLGGFRQSLNIIEIPQTSSTDSTTPQGNLAGYGHTVMSKPIFTKSFTEWGIIIGLVCIRTRHSYSGAIEKQWSRTRRLDYYWPELAHIGEQPVLNKEIYAQGTSDDNDVFGYQEAHADLKYERDINTGAFDPYYATSLASWHYGDKYNSLPVLSGEWSSETKDYVDRTLAVTSAVEDQWLMSCHLDITKTSPMPLYSLPGLIDHF